MHIEYLCILKVRVGIYAPTPAAALSPSAAFLGNQSAAGGLTNQSRDANNNASTNNSTQFGVLV